MHTRAGRAGAGAGLCRHGGHDTRPIPGAVLGALTRCHLTLAPRGRGGSRRVWTSRGQHPQGRHPPGPAPSSTLLSFRSHTFFVVVSASSPRLPCLCSRMALRVPVPATWALAGPSGYAASSPSAASRSQRCPRCRVPLPGLHASLSPRPTRLSLTPSPRIPHLRAPAHGGVLRWTRVSCSPWRSSPPQPSGLGGRWVYKWDLAPLRAGWCLSCLPRRPLDLTLGRAGRGTGLISMALCDSRAGRPSSRASPSVVAAVSASGRVPRDGPLCVPLHAVWQATGSCWSGARGPRGADSGLEGAGFPAKTLDGPAACGSRAVAAASPVTWAFLLCPEGPRENILAEKL